MYTPASEALAHGGSQPQNVACYRPSPYAAQVCRPPVTRAIFVFSRLHALNRVKKAEDKKSSKGYNTKSSLYLCLQLFSGCLPEVSVRIEGVFLSYGWTIFTRKGGTCIVVKSHERQASSLRTLILSQDKRVKKSCIYFAGFDNCAVCSHCSPQGGRSV